MRLAAAVASPAEEETRLVGALRGHFAHHARFYAAGLLGLGVFTATRRLSPSLSAVIAGDAFFAAYLISSAWLARGATPAGLRLRASYEDEGVIAILLLTLLAVCLCLAALFALLREPGAPGAFALGLVGVSVLLSWLTLHTVTAFRYAHLYYAPAPEGDAAGLAFPGTREPGVSDFLYFSLVIGMTSQVSDVQVLSTEMRRTAIAHGVIAFFFNTTILALAVNVAAGFVR